MKMHRMRLITTTNCPFGIEDDETVKGRQAGRKKRVERGEGGVTATGWAADMGRDINWLACHFVYAVCPVNARQLGCEIRKKSKKSEEREECEEQAEQEEEQEYNELAMSSLAHTRQ